MNKIQGADTQAVASLPSRERGLKYARRAFADIWLPVAPFAGAWIEIAKWG